jgi:protein-S-isoprenylcysteine O-methyltransferase Ste14
MRRESQFSISWRPEFVFTLGILLMVLGVVFRWYAIQILGKYFTFQISTQREQIVVQKGPYRFIRHPSYTGTLITMFGLGLAFTNWSSLVCLLIAGLIGYSYRAHVEEAVLISELGDPYKEYMQRTKRFIPFVY